MTFKEIKNSYTFLFLVILSIYAAYTAPFLSSGLKSDDAHGVINCVNNLVNHGTYAPSRPPGHPSSEIYLFLPLSLFLKIAFNKPFDWFIYNSIQYIGGIFTLLIFFILMKKLTADRLRLAFATLTLALSTGYLCNSIDGGEFIFAMGCLLAAIYLVIKPPAIAAKGNSSIWVPILLALGTGFRPELIFSIACFYAVLFYLQPHKNAFIKNLFLQLIFILLVWLPVLWEMEGCSLHSPWNKISSQDSYQQHINFYLALSRFPYLLSSVSYCLMGSGNYITITNSFNFPIYFPFICLSPLSLLILHLFFTIQQKLIFF